MTELWPEGAGLHATSTPPPIEGVLPSFDGATGWLNSGPLTREGLQGNVVVVNFWTYTCVNWLRQLPYVRAWAEKYASSGLVVVGVHTPEFPFEHDIENVRQSAADMGVTYPIALDNEYAVWQAFGNHYWPALYFADGQGRIRHHHYGEGEYARSEMIIRELLAENGFTRSEDGLVSVTPAGVEAAADWASLESPETYTGYEQAENFASPGGSVAGVESAYSVPPTLGLNQWALSGDWTIGTGEATLNDREGAIAYRFHARDLNLVLSPEALDTPVPFRVRVDGGPPGPAHGEDIDDHGNGAVTRQRLYQLIRQQGPITDRTFEITFAGPGVQAYSFTFG
jgi:thiol-disulfide isomerase/thioredoxin